MATAPKTGKTDAKNVSDADEDFVPGATANLPAEFGDEKLVANAVGFPPYFEPEKGRIVDLVCKMIDYSDPTFLRLICQYIGNEPLKCGTGPKDDDGESAEIMVQKGELFTFSWYATLPLEFGLKDGVPIRVVCVKQMKAGTTEDGQPKKLWVWQYMTTAAGSKQIMAEKSRAMAFGSRNPKQNPLYLAAFTPDGLKLSGPNDEMKRLAAGFGDAQTARRAANAEA